MSDPFDALFEGVDQRPQESEWVTVSDSELECERCFQISSKGLYSFKRKTLRWSCPAGHKNVVDNLVIEDD